MSSDTHTGEPGKNTHGQGMLGKKDIYIYLSIDTWIYSKAEFSHSCSSVKGRKSNFMDQTAGDVNKEIHAAFSR